MTALALHKRELKEPLNFGRAEHARAKTARGLLTKGALFDQASTYRTMIGGAEIVGDGADRLERAALAMIVTAELIKRQGIEVVLKMVGDNEW